MNGLKIERQLAVHHDLDLTNGNTRAGTKAGADEGREGEWRLREKRGRAR